MSPNTASSPKSPQRVLIIEAPEVPAVELETLLSKSRFAVDSCGQPQTLEQRFSAKSYDFIILPAWLPPPHSSHAVLKRLRQQKRTRLIPVLLLCDPKKAEPGLMDDLVRFKDVDPYPMPLEPRVFLLKCQSLSRNTGSKAGKELPDGLEPAIRSLHQLSKREEEVLRLIGEGLSNKEISAELTLSEHSVRTHIYNIFTKLNLKRRSQAVLVEIYRKLVL